MDLSALGAWSQLLKSEFEKPYFQSLAKQVDEAYAAGSPRVFPPQEDLFRAFQLTPPDKVKLILTGQVIFSS